MEESIQIQGNSGKKQRMTDTDNNGEDIISNLPESIINRILSLLPTKDVLRTCVLSKDWEYKWTSIYNIDINDRERFSPKMTRHTSFDNFVDRIFILSRASTLKRFRLLCRQQYDERRMMTWIAAALMRNVEDLEIVYDFEGIVLPRCFFDCKTLKKLKLQLPCTFRPTQNCFSNLEVLHLARVKFLNERWPNTSQLKFSFPVLETLELRYCKWLKVNSVEINAPALTELKVLQYPYLIGARYCHIKISGARLQKIGFHDYFGEIFDLSESSVFSAVVDCHSYLDIRETRRTELHARLLLKGCSGLNHLQLSGLTVEDIAQSKQQGPPLPKFNMLKRLEISSKCNSEAFLEFLHSTPFLEWIKLNVCEWYDYDYDLVESMPSCIVSHLNEVEFRGFKGERPHVHLADFFLKNAVELKKMSGLSRKRSEKGQDINNFWARLKKKVFRDGYFEVDSWVKLTAEVERVFG